MAFAKPRPTKRKPSRLKRTIETENEEAWNRSCNPVVEAEDEDEEAEEAEEEVEGGDDGVTNTHTHTQRERKKVNTGNFDYLG